MKIKFSFMAPDQWGKIKDEILNSTLHVLEKYRRSPKSDTIVPPEKDNALNTNYGRKRNKVFD